MKKGKRKDRSGIANDTGYDNSDGKSKKHLYNINLTMTQDFTGMNHDLDVSRQGSSNSKAQKKAKKK